MKKITLTPLILALFTGTFAFAQGPGTVAESCAADIQKFCSDKQHGQGEIRACLEAKKTELSEACKKALDTTGPRKGKGRGR